ncbi:iron-containing redox enzyme family protein [Rhodococcus sp. (in: high G+C Gram-positive bacteria)]|uniref:iron-containing redox enzyme family protein n=1 Tax=Rhodococcus sp. TaxID=1831 RepID=UPI001A080261|nr:iron-containing redox enzyme family protein [Rhodococcus sp. (in: high G+C Gram-positive bacteria)]MBF0660994.1 iron-containing redox enzyme family protein [Rhodococcus sp. (in: high G+C Gram-positive bacteria)]
MSDVIRPCDLSAASLPTPRGPISAAVVERLARPADAAAWQIAVGEPDPYGDDVQLALTVLYELHYRGFDGVDASWEWAPGPLGLRADLERLFLAQLRADVQVGDDTDATFDALYREPKDAWGVSHELAERGTWDQIREFFVHRSIYHLKEADPHAFAIPRLRGRAKAALVAVEFDEYGGGRADRMHSRLYADLLKAADLDESYLGYLDAVPAVTLATVNFMSLCGLHRAHMPMLVGMFTAAEITTAPSARRMASALERLGADPACVTFYTEHIEADAVHELVLRHDVVGDMIAADPRCASDIVFGAEAAEFLEGRLAHHLLDNWSKGSTTLRASLDEIAPVDQPVS